MKYYTSSAEGTKNLGTRLAKKFTKGGIVALYGNLGAGKTTFIQGFACGLGVKARLVSPTYVLTRSYAIPDNTNGKLFHIDLYRVTSDQLYEIGIDEILANPANVTLIEWADKLGVSLPGKAYKVKINLLDENRREIELE